MSCFQSLRRKSKLGARTGQRNSIAMNLTDENNGKRFAAESAVTGVKQGMVIANVSNL